jgi:nucleoside-diphosphate-sugar epimerase
MNKTAVVFGATGLVGSELTVELLKGSEYDKIIIVTRKELHDLNPKLEQIILPDFSGLLQLQDKLASETYFCCIGTTIKIAGTQDAFKKVDYGIPVSIAQLARDLNVANLVIISSIGADSGSPNFYLRTKGEMENEVKRIYSGNLKIVRPSLLMGKRMEYRFAEKFAVFFMKTMGWLFIGPLKKYRGINAADVARAMIRLAFLPSEKVVYESDELQNLCS